MKPRVLAPHFRVFQPDVELGEFGDRGEGRVARVDLCLCLIGSRTTIATITTTYYYYCYYYYYYYYYYLLLQLRRMHLGGSDHLRNPLVNT